MKRLIALLALLPIVAMAAGESYGPGYTDIIIKELKANGTSQIIINKPSLASSYTLTLPDDDGNAGQTLTTNGSGALSWSSGSGSGEINVIDNPNDADAGWTASGAGIAVATTTTAGELPLGGVTETAIKITPSSGTPYVRYRWTMPTALKQRKLKVEWHQRPVSGYATGDLKVEVYKNSASDYSGSYTEFALATDASGTSSIPNQSGKYTTSFDGDDADYYELRIVRTAGTTALALANAVIGPGIQPQGAVVTEWEAWTPTWNGITVGNGTSTGYFRRVGDTLQLRAYITFGTTSSATTFISPVLPNSLTLDTNKRSSDDYVGNFRVADSSTSTIITGIVRATGGGVRLTKDYYGSAGSGDYDGSSPFVLATGDSISVEMTVPILAWSGSGTISMLQDETITEWATYTPTLSWVANIGTNTARYRRVGDSMEVEGRISVSGAPTSATLTVALPTGFTIDTTKLADGSNGGSTLGIAGVDDSGNNHLARVAYSSTTVVSFRNDDGTGLLTETVPFTFASGDSVYYRFSVPILEWSGRGNGAIGFAMADTNYAGLVSTGTQSIAGAKTFTGNVAVGGNVTVGETTNKPADGVNYASGGINTVGDTDAEAGIKGMRVSADANGVNLFGYKSRGTFASKSVPSSDDILLDLRGYSWDTDSWEVASSIRLISDGTTANGDAPGRIAFYTTTDGGTSLTERMRIGNNGNVGIGQAAASDYTLEVQKTVAGDWIASVQNDSATGHGLQVIGASNSSSQEIFKVRKNTSTDAFIVKGDGVAYMPLGASIGGNETISTYDEDASGGGWTPDYKSSGGGAFTQTGGYTARGGSVVKIGKLVHVQFYLSVPATWAVGAATGLLQVNLPYTSTADANSFAVLHCDYHSFDTTGTSVRDSLVCQIGSSSGNCTFEESGDNVNAANTPVATIVGDASYVICSGTYKSAS